MIDECPLEELTEFIEVAEDCIDALWRSVEPYPETRMKQLIQIIGKMITIAFFLYYIILFYLFLMSLS